MKNIVKKVGIAGILLMCLAVSPSFGVVSVTMSTGTGSLEGCVNNLGTPNWLFGTIGGPGASVEIIDAGNDGIANPPSPLGGTTSDDAIIATGWIGIGFPSAKGRTTISVGVNVNEKIYVRVWDGSTEANSTYWGISEVTTVPSGVSIGGWGYNINYTGTGVGSWGAWPIAGAANVYAIQTSFPAPTPGPTITSITPTTVEVGNTIDIIGSNFGTGGIVTVDGVTTTDAGCTKWTSMEITLLTTAGMTAGHAVTVSVYNGSQSTSKNTLDIDPYISSINPTIEVTGVTALTITGGGFGTGPGATITYTGASGIGTGGSGGAIVTTTVPSGGASGPVSGNLSVTVNGMTSNTYPYIMATPTLSLTPTYGYLSTPPRDIIGTNLGTVAAYSTGINKATLNGTALDSYISSWTNTDINIHNLNSPTIVSTAGAYTVVVTAGGSTAAQTPTLYISPEIITVSPATYTIGNNITITGDAFGNIRGTSYVQLVNNGKTYTLTPGAGNWSSTSITLTTAESLPTTLDAGVSNTTVQVFVSNGEIYQSNISQLITCKPNLVAVSQPSGTQSDVITLEGFGFGATKGTSIVSFDSTAPLSYGRWTNTSIEVSVPTLSGNPHSITVTVNGQVGGPVLFTYNAPGLPAISTIDTSPAHLGQTITIKGSNFTNNPTDPASNVIVNGVVVNCLDTDIKSWSASTITLSIEASMTAGPNIPVSVEASGVFSNTNTTSLTIQPWILTTTGTNPAVTGVAPGISLTGGGFGGVSDGVTGIFNANTSAAVVNGSNVGANANNIIVPSGQFGTKTGTMCVTVHGVASNFMPYTMATPSITGINPGWGIVGSSSTLEGGSLGTIANLANTGVSGINNIQLNGTICTINSWNNANGIQFVVPAAITQAGNYPIIVTAGGNTSTETYTVLPQVNTAYSTGYSDPTYYMGNNLVINGTSFGSPIGGSTVTIIDHAGNNFVLHGATSWGTNSITLATSNGLPITMECGSATVQVTVSHSGSFTSNAHAFTVMPYIATVSPTSGLAGTLVTVEGYGFGAQGTGAITFNTTNIPTIESWSNTTIEVLAPSAGPIVVTQNGIPSNNGGFGGITGPYISGFVPLGGTPVNTLLVINGNHFGSPANKNNPPSDFVTIGGVTIQSSDFTSWTDSQIICLVPPSLSTGPQPVVVTTGSNASNTMEVTITSGGGGGISGMTIHSVMFNGRPYITGEVVSSTPIITAVIDVPTAEQPMLDTTYYKARTISIDNVYVSWDAITYSDVPGGPSMPNSYLLTARVTKPIAAGPVKGHYVDITAFNNSGIQVDWRGSVAVMSGAVQVVGAVFNYPNPFKPLSAIQAENTTRIAYTLSVDAPVTIIVYDITGHEVHRGTYNAGTEGGRAGINQVTWSGRDLFSQPVPNGMFIYKIISGNSVIGTGKLVVFD